MADYTYREMSYTQHRWEVRTPTNAVEIDKAITAAVQMWTSKNSRSLPDNALSVTTEDDMVVISFTEENS